MSDQSHPGISSFRKEIADLYPYPIVRAYQRVYRAADPVSQHQLVLGLFETLLKYLAAICLSQYEQDRSATPAISTPRLNSLISSLRRPSLGDWHAFVRDICAHYTRGKYPATPVLGELINFATTPRGQDEYRAMLACFNFLRATYAPAEGGAATRVSFIMLAQKLVTYRNRLAHGAPVTNPSILSERIELILPALEEALLAARFVAEAGLIYIEEVRFNYYRQEYEHILKSYVGATDALPLPPYVTTHVEQALAPQRLYVSQSGAFPQPRLTLHPFLIVALCERSSEQQVFVLNQADPQRIEYICAHCDWVYQPDRIRADFDWLFTDLATYPNTIPDNSTVEPLQAPIEHDAHTAVAVPTPDTAAEPIASRSEQDKSDQTIDPGILPVHAPSTNTNNNTNNERQTGETIEAVDQAQSARWAPAFGLSWISAWLIWSLAIGAGYVATLWYSFIVGSNLSNPPVLLIIYIALIGGLIGAGMGVGQVVALRSMQTPTSLQGWLFATIIAWAIAFVIDAFINFSDLPDTRSAVATGLAINSGIMSVGQWLILRRSSRYAASWIPACIGGTLLGFFPQADAYYAFVSGLSADIFDFPLLLQTVIAALVAGIVPVLTLTLLFAPRRRR